MWCGGSNGGKGGGAKKRQVKGMQHGAQKDGVEIRMKK